MTMKQIKILSGYITAVEKEANDTLNEFNSQGVSVLEVKTNILSHPEMEFAMIVTIVYETPF